MATVTNLTTPIQANLRYLIWCTADFGDGGIYIPMLNSNNTIIFDKNNETKVNTCPVSAMNTPANLSLDYQWQFFEVSNGNFVIANCATGYFIYPSDANVYALGTNTDVCSMFSLMQVVGTDGNTGQQICIRDVTGAGTNFWESVLISDTTNVEISGNPAKFTTDPYQQWILTPYASFDIPDLTGTTNLSLPAFSNGTPPPVYPLVPELANNAYVPYFLVNDPTLPNWSDRISKTPYYRLNQYAQFKLAANMMNNTDGIDTFLENWTYGVSNAGSVQLSEQLGISLGVDVQENEVVLKEEEQTKLNVEFGLSGSYTYTDTKTNMKQISAQAPPGKCVAVYGVMTTYKMFQMNDDDSGFPVAAPNVQMAMDNSFVTIQGDIPTNS